MIPLIPWYLGAIIVATNLGIALSVWAILSFAAARSGLPPTAQQRFRIGAGMFVVAWVGAALLLAPSPDSLSAQDRFALTPSIPFFFIVPAGVVLLAILLFPTVRRVLAAASLPAIIGVQFYRIIGVVFVILLAQGQLPAHFALPAGWGDVVVGLSAPLVALTLARGIRAGRALALAWNGFGLLDLVVAVGMGTGYLAPFLVPELGPRVPPASAMGVFPLILVPTFAVPVSLLLHLTALGRLRRSSQLGLGLTPKVAG